MCASALGHPPHALWKPNNAEGMKMGCLRRAPAWVSWNRRILEIFSTWFSDALRVSIKIHYHSCMGCHRNLNVTMWGCAAKALTELTAAVCLFTYRK